MNLRRMLRGVTLAMALAPSVGFAQALGETDRRARVDLLSRADQALRVGRLDEAIGLIRQAEVVGATAGTGMLSAQVLSQMGRSVAAHAAAERCLRAVELDRQTTEANLSRIRDECSQRRDEALRRASRFTLRVPSGAPSALVVRVNGTVLPPSLYNVEQVVESGAIDVIATAAGHAQWRRAATLAAGAALAVEVELPASASASTQVREASSPPTMVVQSDGTTVQQDRSAHAGSTQRALARVSGAVGLALVGGAVVSSLMFPSAESDYLRDACRERPSDTPTCQSQYGTLEALQALQYVGFIGGGVLVAASAVLFATAPSRAPAVSVGVTADGVGLSYRGRF